ncbi:MAG: N-6 DNA methylase [Synergistaceae bacterium]|jgi:type I restriction enzyme M protein|nr:N-6 DNA methylase [Synergistaceae bacterium]
MASVRKQETPEDCVGAGDTIGFEIRQTLCWMWGTIMDVKELLKNTAYGDSVFTDTEIAALERGVTIKQIKGKDTPHVVCAVRHKEIRLTPEELVRQLYVRRLLKGYGYPVSRLELEYHVHFGREVKRADIVIFDKDRPTVPYIVVELKKPKLLEGKEQLRSYCNATGAPIGVWTNGQNISHYNRKDPNYFEEITDIPKASQKLSDIINERFTIDDLRRVDKIANEKRSLRSIIEEMEDEVLANAGVDSFEEIFKLLFAKLYDELVCIRDSGEYLKFRNSGDTDAELKTKIQSLFDSAKGKWEGIFSVDAKIQLSPSHLAVCVSHLQNVKLFNNNLDVVDDAFEYLMSKTQKGEKGQYFTPRYVIDMCVKMMNPQENENIIDTSAGSSGFPVHAIFHVWRDIRERKGLPAGELFTAEQRTTEEIDFVRDHVFAIDFDEKTVRVARTLNLISGDGQSNVMHLNTLDYPRWKEVIGGEEWNDTYNEGFKKLKKIRPLQNDDYSEFSFDLLMANPPFAGDIKESAILTRYELAKNDKGKWQNKVGRDVLFIERNLNFLKPGGRMAIVLPQGRFNNSSDKRIREYIAERCRILAVVGLHGNVFKPHTGTKTSVLFIQKWDDEKCPRRDDYPIFFATMQKPSKDNSGEKIYLKDAGGNYLLDSHGHLIVDHDLFNHDGMTRDGIAEAFIEFAKREKLSFFVDARPFDADYYAALMSGLEISEVLKSELEFSMRIDSEYYKKIFLQYESEVDKNPNTSLKELASFLIGPFGSAYDTDRYVEQSEYRYIRGQDVKPFLLMDSEPRYMAENDYFSLNKYALKTSDVLISVVGTLGNACIVREKDIPAIFSCKSTVIRAKEVNPYFLVAYFNSKYDYVKRPKSFGMPNRFLSKP